MRNPKIHNLDYECHKCFTNVYCLFERIRILYCHVYHLAVRKIFILRYTLIYCVAFDAPIRFIVPLFTIAPETAFTVVGLTPERILHISALGSDVRQVNYFAKPQQIFPDKPFPKADNCDDRIQKTGHSKESAAYKKYN